MKMLSREDVRGEMAGGNSEPWTRSRLPQKMESIAVHPGRQHPDQARRYKGHKTILSMYPYVANERVRQSTLHIVKGSYVM